MSKHTIDIPNCVFAAFCSVIDGFMTFNRLFPKKSRTSKRDSAFFTQKKCYLKIQERAVLSVYSDTTSGSVG
jgi:hypothetical protein